MVTIIYLVSITMLVNYLIFLFFTNGKTLEKYENPRAEFSSAIIGSATFADRFVWPILDMRFARKRHPVQYIQIQLSTEYMKIYYDTVTCNYAFRIKNSYVTMNYEDAVNYITFWYSSAPQDKRMFLYTLEHLRKKQKR